MWLATHQGVVGSRQVDANDFVPSVALPKCVGTSDAGIGKHAHKRMPAQRRLRSRQPRLQRLGIRHVHGHHHMSSTLWQGRQHFAQWRLSTSHQHHTNALALGQCTRGGRSNAASCPCDQYRIHDFKETKRPGLRRAFLISSHSD